MGINIKISYNPADESGDWFYQFIEVLSLIIVSSKKFILSFAFLLSTLQK